MSNALENLPNGFDPEFVKQLLGDRKVLAAVTRQSFLYFFYVYFGRYIKYPIAPFHFRMFEIAQNEEIKRAGVMTFRNSGKSTLLNTAFALWAIMGSHQNKHVVIASQTQQRAKDHLMNIRKEIEENKLLRENLGPFEIGEDRWGATILIIPAYEARISAISVEEGIRGLKEGPYRPDLIIADDIEDSSSVKTRESRDKTYDWFTGELIPLGESDAKVIVLGNFLHQDSVLSRLEEKIKKGEMKGVFLRFPIVDENSKIAWPGKFASLEAIEELKRNIGNEITWQRDFMMRAVYDNSQIIDPKWIQYYDGLPGIERKNNFIDSYTGIDLAISEKDTADFTAMVSGKVYVYDDDDKLFIYILPDPVNERLNFPETVERAKLVSKILGNGSTTDLIIENVGYQKSLIDQLKKDGYPAEGFQPEGQDKRTRLALTTDMIKSGRILFPKEGAENLIRQLTGFGNEKYDDLADAFSILVLHIRKNIGPCPRIIWI